MARKRSGIDVMQAHHSLGPGFDKYLEIARAADGAGVDELHISDHVAMSESAIRRRPTYPWPLDMPYYEPLTALAAIAVATGRIRLATNVLIGPLRSALFLARHAATVDAISGGRLELGLGLGWQREEFDASNVDFADRRAILIDQIDAMRALWSSAPASFLGQTVEFEGMHSLPLPPQGRALPITLGVPATPANLRLVAERADGWSVMARTADEVEAGVRALRATLSEAGREPASVRVIAKLPPVEHGTSERSLTLAREYFAAGADTVVSRLHLEHGDPARLRDHLAGLVAVSRQAEAEVPL